MSAEIRVEAKGLAGLQRHLRMAAERVRLEVDKDLAVIGAKLVVEAKAEASRHSQTIPGSIRLEVLPGAIRISAGGPDVPVAALYELGNKRSSRSATTFRHPVFGDRGTWVDQPKHPYLRPTLVANRRAITKQLERSWPRALRSAGIEVE